MQKNQSFSIRARADSFKYALNGVTAFFRSEPNALLHLMGTILVVLLGIAVRVSRFEMIALIFAIGFVWVAELFNTCIEKAMDLISSQKDSRIGFIKDLSAGAVLVAAIV